MVTDKSEPRIPEDLSWNREIFRHICQLGAQVTVDISKIRCPKSCSGRRTEPSAVFFQCER